ncbi:MAG: MmgE/PrpD family protein [Rhizobiaceae bacterium]|nr:MmgE/PrpD family protein [Hyphomicrobiales bacterium]NRB31802.1 MmgE/PrpD family protein [Rhizobiaceae bacterium]
MTNTPLAAEFARWVSAQVLADVPDPVLECARRAMLDTIGVIVAGSVHPGVQKLARHMAGVKGGCVAASGLATDPISAATINGMAAHVWDFDDNSYTGMIHGSAVIFPAVFAVGQEAGASSDDILLAFLLGSEIAYTLGEICTHSHFLRGWWPTGTCGLIGATAGVCKILGLTAHQTANAIGTAAVSAGIERAIAGTDAKPYLVGNVAGQAITLARAAQAGLTGPHEAFEQKNGFFSLLNGGHPAVVQAKELGERWRIHEPGLLFKTSPVCSGAHAAIEATATLLKDKSDRLEEIEHIAAEVPQLVADSLVYDRPTNTQEAQFSLPYSVACAALHGRVRLADLEEVELHDALKLGLMAKTSMLASAELSEEPLASECPESTKITIRYVSGETETHFCGEAFGMPRRPLSDADLVEKFNDCLRFGGLVERPIDLQGVDLSLLATEVLGATRLS